MNSVIFGAHGQIGQRLTQRLAQNPHQYIYAVIRDSLQQQRMRQLGADEVIVANLAKPEELDALPQATDTVIFVAGSQGTDLTHIDQNAAMHIGDLVKQQNIAHYIVLSSFGADANSQNTTPLRDYLIAKGRADDYIQQLGIPYTLVRPGFLSNQQGTGCIESRLSELDCRNKTIPRDDVAHILALITENRWLINECFEVIGGNTPIAESLAQLNQRAR